ncbi:MAG: hypothetical protein ACE10D_12035 [Planctomycetota bacterium]|nr:hypothetical protein [Planctomycetota bacterium]
MKNLAASRSRLLYALAGCLLLSLCTCSEDTPDPASAPAKKPLDPAAWWKLATSLPSGEERILSPREMRDLLAEGDRLGHNMDPEWWKERRRWVFSRILELDAEDVQANEGMGMRTLRSYPGFTELWERMNTTTVSNERLDSLIDRFQPRMSEGLPIFLSDDEYTLTAADLKQVEAHLARLANDPRYAEIQKTLSRVRADPALSGFPFVYLEAGSFLLFYSGRDLTRIEREDPEEEEARVAARRGVYERTLKERAALYSELLDDLRKLYPTLLEEHPVEGQVLCQWTFSDAAYYKSYMDLIDERTILRRRARGHLDPTRGWALLYDDPEGNEDAVRETAAYLAAQQLLLRWSRDPKAGNRTAYDRSHALWLLEGWPSYIAARRVKNPEIGRRVLTEFRKGARLPKVRRIVEQRNWYDLNKEPAGVEEGDDEVPPVAIRTWSFPDLSWSLVEALHEPKYRASTARLLRQVVGGERGDASQFEENFRIKIESDWDALNLALLGFWGELPSRTEDE